MRAAVVYESSFGNTRDVAAAVAHGLGASLHSVDEEPPDFGDLDLLVVGGPTHVHGLSGERSRKAAKEQGAPGASGIGAREFVDHLPATPTLSAAAFDTRIRKPVALTGSAARGLTKRLRRHGCRLAAPPESFFVEGTGGPLAPGAWGRSLAGTR
jgi:hypothetical protein